MKLDFDKSNVYIYLMTNFSKRLKEIRSDKNLTQKQLGDKLNVTDSSIRDWEKGRTQPNLETICELAKIFNVTAGQLLGTEDY